MSEEVGKGCDCMYLYEKHYIELLFSERIEEEKKKLAEVKDILDKMPEESKERFEGAPRGYEMFIRDLETVQKRFQDMPACK